jgi:putative MATE family efflux protein
MDLLNNQTNSTNVFEQTSIPKSVAALVIPAIISALVLVFYNMADTFFVGQTGDPNQVAAVALAMPIFLLFMACGNIFGMGGASLISRLLGQGNRAQVKNVCSFCFYACIATGLVLMAVMLLCMPFILELIGCSDYTRELARNYLTYTALGGVFVIISGAFSNIIRAEGASKVAMVGMMIGTMVNIVLDPIMILSMNMGVTGAAIATIIGNICTVIFYLWYLLRLKTVLSISPQDFSMREGIVRGIMAIGVPASLTNVLMSAANIIMNTFLVSYSDAAVAAMGIAMRANILLMFLQLGLAMGVQPLIGYTYGAQQYGRMKQVISFSVKCNIVIGVVLTVLYFVFTKAIIEIFITDTEVVVYGTTFLRALTLTGPVIGIMFVLNSAFQAIGMAIPSLLLSISRQGLMFLPVLIIGNAIAGLDGLVYAQPIADIGTLLISLIMFISVNKKLTQKVEEENDYKIYCAGI